MTRKLFGTDGVRGTANTYPMTAEMALKIGAAAGRYFRNDGSNGHRVVIGKDTRLSGYMFENALVAGLTSTGMNVLLLGPTPPILFHQIGQQCDDQIVQRLFSLFRNRSDPSKQAGIEVEVQLCSGHG